MAAGIGRRELARSLAGSAGWPAAELSRLAGSELTHQVLVDARAYSAAGRQVCHTQHVAELMAYHVLIEVPDVVAINDRPVGAAAAGAVACQLLHHVVLGT